MINDVDTGGGGRKGRGFFNSNMGASRGRGSDEGSGKFKILLPDDSGESRIDFSSLLSQSVSLEGNRIPSFSGSNSETSLKIEKLGRRINFLRMRGRKVLIEESFEFFGSEDVSGYGLT